MNMGVGIGSKDVAVDPGVGLEVGAGAGMGEGVGTGTDIVIGIVGARLGGVSGRRTSSLSCLFSAVKHQNLLCSSTNSSGIQLRYSLSQPCWSLYPCVWPKELPACSHRM